MMQTKMCSKKGIQGSPWELEMPEKTEIARPAVKAVTSVLHNLSAQAVAISGTVVANVR